jgi:hypothetical protein
MDELQYIADVESQFHKFLNWAKRLSSQYRIAKSAHMKQMLVICTLFKLTSDKLIFHCN